jgi:hypothetical protein
MTIIQFSNTLTPEETMIWDCARHWKAPKQTSFSKELDWEKVLQICQSNRMQVLFVDYLKSSENWEKLPSDIQTALEEDYAKLERSAHMMSESLSQFLQISKEKSVEAAILKGLWLSINLYGNPATRPGGDIDILVRRNDVQDCLKILDEMGLGRWWPNLLDDAYYDRHHLHQQRCTQDLKIWFEIHWAIEHPYTLLTIDYDALMDRTTPGVFLGEPVQELALSDLLLLISIHLVKHAIYLPQTLHRTDLLRLILADGMLMYFLDIVEFITHFNTDLDWDFILECTHQWGASDILGSVLRVCRDYFAAPVPDQVIENLPVTSAGRLTQSILNQMADYELATYLGEKPDRLWEFLVVTNGAFIVRPIRILDTFSYFFPPPEFIGRRYGASSFFRSVKHFGRAFKEFSRLGIDTLYFSWERYRRLKALNQSASIFNRLEIDV